MNIRVLLLGRVGNFFGRLFGRCRQALENAHHNDYLKATRLLLDRANHSIKNEQNELGDKITLYLARRLRKINCDFVSIQSDRDNGSSYSIFLSEKEAGVMNETEVVIIHINLHQIPYPIIVRGLYERGLWGEEGYFAKDPVSVALMVTTICKRFKAGGYLIKPAPHKHQNIDFVSLALSN